jgi:ribonuclease VapC
VIVDTSALVAIIRREPGYRAYIGALAAAGTRRISAASYLEAAIVLDRSADEQVRGALDEVLRDLGIEVAPVTAEQARLARRAHLLYGRGTGHPARLNFGDCFAYALAKERDEPLLYKGDDFSQTDISLAGRREDRHRMSELIAAYGVTTG